MFLTVENIKDRIVPLTLGDWMRIQQWLKRKPIEDAKLYAAGLSTEFQQTAMRQALELSRDISITSIDGMQMIASPEGASRLVFETLKKTDDKLTFDSVMESINMENMQPLVDAIMDKNGFNKTKNLPAAS